MIHSCGIMLSCFHGQPDADVQDGAGLLLLLRCDVEASSYSIEQGERRRERGARNSCEDDQVQQRGHALTRDSAELCARARCSRGTERGRERNAVVID